jgi:hypothetical protein
VRLDQLPPACGVQARSTAAPFRQLAHSLRKRHRWQWRVFRREFTTPTGRWLPIAEDAVAVLTSVAVTVLR